MNNRQKDRIRLVIRIVMVVVAVALLIGGLGVPIANNAVALGIQRDLEALPLPPDTTVEEAVSGAGKLSGNGNGMQYFGAVLLHSTLSLEQLNTYYVQHRRGLFDCLVAVQEGSEIQVADNGNLSFSTAMEGEGWYILYTWGDAPKGLRAWLDTDMRGH
ncbi:MAG: hypothetical protein IJ518_06860 [Clostridia bacterium]|nr:hypothetical protein [Clostridia bacterium]